MFIQVVENNGAWAVCCEQGQPCYTELQAEAGAVLLTGRGQIALLLPEGSKLRVVRKAGRWVFLAFKGQGSPSPALREEVADFLTPLWESYTLSHYCN